MLNIIKEIQETSIEAVVEKYQLVCKDYGHKFLLKYSQINSIPFKAVEAVRECRGLVLRKSDLKVLSYPFKRFFNLGESCCDTLDFSKTKIFKKEDGSLIAVYWDEILNDFCVQTSGTADANTQVGDFDTTFEKLFYSVVGDDFKNKLNKNLNYVFELCTPYNIVVTPHTESFVRLLNVRNLTTLEELQNLEEIASQLNVKAAEEYNFNSLEEIVKAASDLDQTLEGFVLYDGKNRVKIKNPKWLVLSYNKETLSRKSLFEVCVKGEQDEFLAYFPQYKNQIQEIMKFLYKIQVEVDKLNEKINVCVFETKKDFALFLQMNFNQYTNIFQKEFYNRITITSETYEKYIEKIKTLHNNLKS